MLRRGPYVSAGGMNESVSDEPVTLQGRFVNLYDPHLGVLENPRIAPDTRWLLVDLSRCPSHAWVVAAAGRMDDETLGDHSLSFTVSGMAQTTCAVRVLLPVKPGLSLIDSHTGRFAWDDNSHTALLEFPNSPQGIKVRLEW